MRGRGNLVGVLVLGLMLAVTASLSLAQSPAPQAELGTVFTYQGRLTDASGPVNDICNTTFKLYDEAGAGSPPIGGTLLGTDTQTGVEVSDGLFTVALDFGTAVFTGDARWLEIAVDCGEGVVVLSPRQALTAAPYALYASAAGSAAWEGLEGVPTGFADGTDNDTTYTVGVGLTLSDTTLSMAPTYRLPQTCTNGQIPEWDGAAWICGNDDVSTGGGGGDITAVYAGTGITGGGESGAVTLHLSTTYRLPQTCANGQIAEWDGAAWACGNDDTGGGGAFWALTGNAGTTPGTHFLGTTDNEPLELRVNGTRALRLEPSGTSPNLVAGFSGNRVQAGVVGATVSGGGSGSGWEQRVTDTYGTVGGGGFNWAGNADGDLDNASYATVAGGWHNIASGPWSAALSGFYNQASGDVSTVAGGASNMATGLAATVGGGVNNQVIADYGTIAGGGPSDLEEPETTRNGVTDEYGTIGGGGNNQAGNDDGDPTNRAYATVGGGLENTASGFGATAGGGAGNIADTKYSTIGGGEGNVIDGAAYHGTIGGGGSNVIMGTGMADYATVAGGDSNVADGEGCTVGGGEANSASYRFAVVAGGHSNEASGFVAAVGGGIGNDATGHYSSIGGGFYNTCSGDGSTIAGGGGNLNLGWGLLAITNTVSSVLGSVGGGGYNTVDGVLATVAGGYSNTASGAHSTIGGGWENQTSGQEATVGGGKQNQATGTQSTVAGGAANIADYRATVSGGLSNHASGKYAMVPGGYSNEAAGDHSFAAGRRARANNAGCFVWGDSYDGEVACNVNNRWVARTSGGVYFYTNTALTSGVRVSSGGNSWASVSDRNQKEDFQELDYIALVERLANEVPITTWNYRSQDPSIRHIGPMAQDFHAAFGVGEDERYISTVDADGVAFAAIQGLYQLVQEKDAQLSAQQEQIDELAARLASLEALVDAMAQAETGGEQ